MRIANFGEKAINFANVDYTKKEREASENECENRDHESEVDSSDMSR